MADFFRLIRATCCVAATLGLELLAPSTTTLAAAEANKPHGLDAPTAAFFQKHCLRCHGAKQAEGDLRLDNLEGDLDRRDVFTRWHTIVERLRAGEMPPEDEPQPAAAELTAAIDYLHNKLEAASERRRQSGRARGNRWHRGR